MPLAREHVIAAVLLLSLSSCASRPTPGVMTFDRYRETPHPVPYVLSASGDSGSLLYYGAAHSNDPAHPQAGQIEFLWNAFQPTFALNEGGDPPAELSRDLAIGRHGEAGLVRFLAARDNIPVASLDPPLATEAAHLRADWSAEELVLFYVLRWVMQDSARPPEFRQTSIEQAVGGWLWSLADVPALAGGPGTLAEFEQACRRRLPALTDWRAVPSEWFDPAPPGPVTFLNKIARAASEFRDAHMVDAIDDALRSHERVLGVVGASHVVMQEPALRARLRHVSLAHLPPAEDSANQVVSLLGRRLEPPPIPDARRAELTARLARFAQRTAAPSPSEDDYIWHGRTLAYLHRYREAIEVFARGLARFPDSHRLLRHRGHRFITIRDLPSALADLQAADRLITDGRIPDEVEPDGAPNRHGVPRSTTNTNILYHLGLVHYLQGDFAQAAATFQRALDISPNDDMTVATVNWLFLSHRREGDAPGARAALEHVHDRMQILENDAYERLCRVYHGRLAPGQALPVGSDDAVGTLSVTYALSVLDELDGRPAAASARLNQLVESPLWPAFAVIAAEADLARRQAPP